MDEIVLRAMQKWPNVPAVYGWLTLDRRGNWSIKSHSGNFERVSNPAIIDFIGRNYTSDNDGRWYFQNGPQQVFVSLDYTPWIYRLNDTGTGLITHTGTIPKELHTLFADETGALLLQTNLGGGLFLDRDLSAFLTLLAESSGEKSETLIDKIINGKRVNCRLFGQSISIEPIRALNVPDRLRFIQRPTPPAGQPDC